MAKKSIRGDQNKHVDIQLEESKFGCLQPKLFHPCTSLVSSEKDLSGP